MFEEQNTKDFKYALIISGWSNSQIKLYTSGSFGSAIASSDFSVGDVNDINAYQVIFDEATQIIQVIVNGYLAFSFVDSNYQASNAQYISFSQYSSNVVIGGDSNVVQHVEQCPNYPYSPRNGVFEGGDWEFFCSAWNLAQPGTGSLIFNATGNDIYVGLFDEPFSKNFQYAFIISGWSNTLIHLYTAGSFGTAIAEMPFSVKNVDVYNNYEVDFDASTKTFKIFVNGQIVFQYTDPNYSAGNAQYISFSQYSSNVVIGGAVNVVPNEIKHRCPLSKLSLYQLKAKRLRSYKLKA